MGLLVRTVCRAASLGRVLAGSACNTPTVLLQHEGPHLGNFSPQVSNGGWRTSTESSPGFPDPPYVSSLIPPSGPAPALHMPNLGTAQFVTATPLGTPSSSHSWCLGTGAANPSPSTTPSSQPCLFLAHFSSLKNNFRCGISLKSLLEPRHKLYLTQSVQQACVLTGKEVRFVWCPSRLANPWGQAPVLLLPLVLSKHM